MRERYEFHLLSSLLFPNRTIRDREPFVNSEDQRLVQKLNTGKTRLFALLIPETQHLSQSERIGLLYFVSIVFNFDNALDNNSYIKIETEPQRLESIVLSRKVEKADITLGELKNTTLDHFSPHKKDIIERSWSDMLSYQSHLAERIGEQKARKYTYDDALAYRQATNDKLVEVLCALRDIVDPKAIVREQQRVFLIQLIDDAIDWKEDVVNDGYNLFVGLATQYYPHEFDLMARYSRKEDYGLSRISRRRFMRQQMPQTHSNYSTRFNDVLSSVTRKSTRLAYQMARMLAF